MKQFSFKEAVSLILQKLHKHLHVKYQLFLSHFSETPIILTDFRKILIKFDTFEFNENVSSGSRIVPHRQTDEQPGRHDEAHNQFLYCLVQNMHQRDMKTETKQLLYRSGY